MAADNGGHDDEIPSTVGEMLSQLGQIDTNGLRELGKGIGAIYKGILDETDDQQVAIVLASSWVTAMVCNATDDDDEGDADQ